MQLTATEPTTPDASPGASLKRAAKVEASSLGYADAYSMGEPPSRQLLTMPSYLPDDQPEADELQRDPADLIAADAPSPSPGSEGDTAAVLAALFKQQQQRAETGQVLRVSCSPTGASAAHPVLMQRFSSFNLPLDAAGSQPTSRSCGPAAAATAAGTASSSDPVTPTPQPPGAGAAVVASPGSPDDAGDTTASGSAEHDASGGRPKRTSSSSSMSATSAKVSLLSQQLADARGRTAAIEAAGGASGRGQSLFWQHIHSTAPLPRSHTAAAVAAAATAAAADASKSSEQARSAAWHQQQQQRQQAGSRLSHTEEVHQHQSAAPSASHPPYQQHQQQGSRPQGQAATGSSWRSAGGRLLGPSPSQHVAPQNQQQQQQQQHLRAQQRPLSEPGPTGPMSGVSTTSTFGLGECLLGQYSWEGSAAGLGAAEASEPLLSEHAGPHSAFQQHPHHGQAAGAAGSMSPQAAGPGSLHWLPERLGLLHSPSARAFLMQQQQQLLLQEQAQQHHQLTGRLQQQGSGVLLQQQQGQGGGALDPKRLALYVPAPPPPPQQQHHHHHQEQALHPQLYWPPASPDLREPLLGAAHGSHLIAASPLPLGPQLGVPWQGPAGGWLVGDAAGGSAGCSSRRGRPGAPASAAAPAAGAPAGLGDFQQLMEQLLEGLSCFGQVPAEEAGADLAAACSIHHVCFNGPPVVAGPSWWEGQREHGRELLEHWASKARRRAAGVWCSLQQLWRRGYLAARSVLPSAAAGSYTSLLPTHAPPPGVSHVGAAAGGRGVAPLGRQQSQGYRPWR